MVDFASIASGEIRAYFRATLKDILRAYPEINGVFLDRAEQPAYTLGDAFVDFGPHADRWRRWWDDKGRSEFTDELGNEPGDAPATDGASSRRTGRDSRVAC